MTTTRTALVLLGFCGLATARNADDPPEWRDRRPKCPVQAWNALEGQPAPALTDLGSWVNTDPLDWEGLRGNVVLLHLWGAWAGARDLPHLTELHQAHQAAGLVVLGVHSKRGSAGHERVVGEQALPFVVAADLQGTLAEKLSMKFWPATFLIDRDGQLRIAGVNRKPDEAGKAWLDHALEALLAEPWRGERQRVAYRTPEQRARALPARWPDTPAKQLNARDVRGQQGPDLDGLTWLTEPPALEGKCVLIDLWATWCGPCVRGMGALQELHERFGRDLVVIGVSDQHPEARNPRDRAPWGDVVAAFLEARPYTYPQALDRGGRLKGALGVTAIPHALLMDSDGVVRWQGVPGQQPDHLSPELVAQVIAADREQRGAGPGVPGDGGGPQAAPAGWPPLVTKKLYAATDLRGKPAPEFRVGEWLTAEPERAGKVVLIDFWATWCAPCRQLIPEMNQWAAHFGDDLVMIGVSDEDAVTVRGFLDRVQVDYAMAIDPEARMKGALGVSGIPHVMVIDSQGIVRWQGFPGDKSDRLTRTVLERIVAEDERQRPEDS